MDNPSNTLNLNNKENRHEKDHANCSLAEGVYYSLYKDHPMFAENMELIQMAAVTGREIFLRIYENSNVCEISYVKVIY
ncbi:MAG: hypothetical protein CR972_01235 [Candidatus Moraniibacteriota bacterium]|nr:MAG: hypothetical protein CR972_01235 [Candidatus Moranbacteria bacterium]